MIRLRLWARITLIIICVIALFMGMRIAFAIHGNGLFFLFFIFPWMAVLAWALVGGPIKDEWV